MFEIDRQRFRRKTIISSFDISDSLLNDRHRIQLEPIFFAFTHYRHLQSRKIRYHSLHSFFREVILNLNHRPRLWTGCSVDDQCRFIIRKIERNRPTHLTRYPKSAHCKKREKKQLEYSFLQKYIHFTFLFYLPKKDHNENWG